MEGRPPFDPDDDLEFDFDTGRHRQVDSERSEGDWADDLTEERPAGGEPPPEPGSSEMPAAPDDDSFDTGERPRERPQRRRKGFRLGRRRRRDRPTTEERRARSSAGAYETGEYGTGEYAPAGTGEYGTGEYATGEHASDEYGTPAYETGEYGTGEQLRDDPYTPARVSAGERRRHRRDLPARVRRRQALAAGAVVVLLIGGATLVLGGGGDEEEEKGLPLKRLVGQSVIAPLANGGPDKALLKSARKGQIGGVILTTANETVLGKGLAALQKAASAGGNPPLLVLVDQEGGAVKRLPGPPELSPPDMAETGDPGTAESEGSATGEYLKSFGVNVDLAPVLDVATPQTADTIADRTFSDDAAIVAEFGSAFIQGIQSQGVAATAKHFPGLGPATVNTDFAPARVVARQEVLDAALTPFEAAVDAQVQLVMVSSAIYPAYGGETDKDPNKPAVFSKTVVQGLLREQLGFGGVVITDDLESIAIKELTTRETAGVTALGAGCDLILYAKSAQGAAGAFNQAVRAAKAERIPRAQLEQSYERVTNLKSALGAA